MVCEPSCRMLVEFPDLSSYLIFDCVLFLPFQEYALSHCDVTCLEHMSPLLFAGTTSGSVIIWNLETEKIALRYSNYVYSIYELQRGVYRHYRSCCFLWFQKKRKRKKKQHCIEKSFDWLAGEPLVCPGKWSSWPDILRSPVVILAALHSIRCLLAWVQNWINGFIGSFASGVFRQNLQVRTVANTSAITRMSSWCIDAFIWFIGSGNPSFTAKGTIIHYQIYRNVKV